MINCREATKLMSRARDARLTFGERVALRLHLALCEMCRRYQQHIGFLGVIARHLDKAAERHAKDHSGLDQAARADILDKVKRRLAQPEEEPAAPGADQTPRGG